MERNKSNPAAIKNDSYISHHKGPQRRQTMAEAGYPGSPSEAD